MATLPASFIGDSPIYFFTNFSILIERGDDIKPFSAVVRRSHFPLFPEAVRKFRQRGMSGSRAGKGRRERNTCRPDQARTGKKTGGQKNENLLFTYFPSFDIRTPGPRWAYRRGNECPSSPGNPQVWRKEEEREEWGGNSRVYLFNYQ
jgi:hypothetical protein